MAAANRSMPRLSRFGAHRREAEDQAVDGGPRPARVRGQGRGLHASAFGLARDARGIRPRRGRRSHAGRCASAAPQRAAAVALRRAVSTSRRSRYATACGEGGGRNDPRQEIGEDGLVEHRRVLVGSGAAATSPSCRSGGTIRKPRRRAGKSILLKLPT